MHIVANVLIGLSAIAVVFIGARFVAALVSAETSQLVRRHPLLHIGLFLTGLVLFYVLQIRPALNPHRRKVQPPNESRQATAAPRLDMERPR